MNKNIEVLRSNLEMLIMESHSLTDSKVIVVSQQLDKLIVKQQLYDIQISN
ncbi:aspartyl-phosphate phosphatase Spo0E family protein [Clostridium psychrophilum]|uniref:aspartyl-phosphate phosphatase Spo0E family protein n=1 Tax=Clostridium psychrophilum TaxID=132926 RepID=UPI001C0AF708|nr:aspartyl-phosphate phosphatase Spo0E family protein [Clostridium psychrophilum]MBU3182521.1 aspartyl-phosphate phosphatase Spo0E family protein [Clostridium psychrophilum]